MKKNRGLLSKLLLTLLALFLYAPIIYVIIFSFNGSKSLSKFSNFSLHWYQKMFNDAGVLDALYNTIAIALIATIVSVIVGTLASIGLSKSRKIVKDLVNQINNLPIMNPEIVTAIGLMLFFTSIHMKKGFLTLLLAHIAFCIPYVMLSVAPRLRSLDENLANAAMDLGATPFYALRKVIIPEIMPGIIAGALIAFTMSFDDFVISYFVSGNGISNISILVYTMSKRINPTINALSTIVIILITFTLLLINILSILKKHNQKAGKYAFVSVMVVFCLLLGGLNGLKSKNESKFNPIKEFGSDTLNVFNWGEYIDTKTIEKFEKKYNVKVNYTMYASNEEMYTKLLGGEHFDVIYPSDYMIQKLKDENLLRKINKKAIPNYKNIDHQMLGLPYDKNNDYSVPYFGGSVGIVYNSKKVNQKDVEKEGYNILQDKKYNNKIYMYDSERDSFMVALKALGYSMNTTNIKEIKQAFNWLIKMKKNTNPIYVTDEVIDGMINSEKDIAVVYSGDASYILSENKDMKYYEPKSGTNIWTDCMAIPKNADSPKLAEAWINFNLNEKIAENNSKYVGYTSSSKRVKDKLANTAYKNINSYQYRQGYIKDEVFKYNKKIKRIMSELWIKVKASK